MLQIIPKKNLSFSVRFRNRRTSVNYGLVIFLVIASLTTWFLTEYTIYGMNTMNLMAGGWVNKIKPMRQAQTLSPYPKSSVITGVSWDFASHKELAPGSDIWFPAWASDGNLYALWGDGGGFGGTSDECRIDGMGIGRIEGNYDNYVAYDYMARTDSVCTAFCADYGGDLKSMWAFGMVSVGGTFYMYPSNANMGSTPYYSTDLGCTWKIGAWSFGSSHTDTFPYPVPLQMGQDNTAAKDNYLYVYSPEAASPWDVTRSRIYLARVTADHVAIMTESQYEFYSGSAGGGDPASWTSTKANRTAVFQWTNNVGSFISVSYSADLDRYFLTFNRCSRCSGAQFAIFESRNPWGPWYEVAVYSDWGNFGETPFYHFVPKWWRNNSKDFTLIFSGRANDSWNTVNGSFILTTPACADVDD